MWTTVRVRSQVLIEEETGRGLYQAASICTILKTVWNPIFRNFSNTLECTGLHLLRTSVLVCLLNTLAWRQLLKASVLDCLFRRWVLECIRVQEVMRVLFRCPLTTPSTQPSTVPLPVTMDTPLPPILAQLTPQNLSCLLGHVGPSYTPSLLPTSPRPLVRLPPEPLQVFRAGVGFPPSPWLQGFPRTL